MTITPRVLEIRGDLLSSSVSASASTTRRCRVAVALLLLLLPWLVRLLLLLLPIRSNPWLVRRLPVRLSLRPITLLVRRAIPSLLVGIRSLPLVPFVPLVPLATVLFGGVLYLSALAPKMTVVGVIVTIVPFSLVVRHVEHCDLVELMKVNMRVVIKTVMMMMMEMM